MYLKRYIRTLSIFNFRKSRGDFQIIAICLDGNTKSQYWSVVALLYRAIVSIFAFTAIYPWPIFALHLLVSALAHASNCIHLAVVFTSAFASRPFTSLFLAFSILHCSSFGTVIRFLVPFHEHNFCLALFCQQPFWIFISVILKFA